MSIKSENQPLRSSKAGSLETALMWSDRFFNHDDIGYAWNESGNDFGFGKLKEVADRFLKQNPDCPYTADELKQDFLRRV